VRLLGDRARQLSMGAKSMIKNIEVMDPRAIAKLELEKKVIPLIILRELPNGQIEKWRIDELNLF
jgi:DNA-directed RNA polymerase subunit K/omega